MKKYFLFLMLLLIISIIGCIYFRSSDCIPHPQKDISPIIFILDKESKNLREDVEYACDRWGIERCLYSDMDSDNLDLRHNGPGLVPISTSYTTTPSAYAYAESNVGSIDHCTILKSRIVMPKGLEPALRKRYITHEIGHVLGYGHNFTNPKCVMYQGPIYGDFEVYGPNCIEK